MSNYVMLFRYTQEGITKIKDSPVRVEAAKKLCRELGGEVKLFFALLGSYDTMIVLEAPNDETAARIAAGIGRQGFVRTETWRAFDESEQRQILSKLPG
jgi:uncharacterized protein with GYD domain